MMRRLFALTTLALVACTTPVAPPPRATTVSPHGLTFEEEATILRLEDRREFDRSLAEQWAAHPNALHRKRIALALGRIGQATFDDKNRNGEKDAGETMAGVDILARLARDSESEVRRDAAFALGETGDAAGVEPLFALATDADASVAAEAVEAISKLGGAIPRDRYIALTAESVPLGVRARAVRYLFRLNDDAASAIAAELLSNSDIDIRREAAYALSRRAFAGARERLEPLLADRDTLTRAYAARALGIIGAPESTGSILNATSDVHPWVRTNALRALSQIAQKTPNAIDREGFANDALKLITLTNDPDPGTRVTAVEPLGYYAKKSQTAQKRLLDLAVHGNSWQREIAAGTIARHFGEAAGGPLQSLLATDAAWVKVRILEATPDLKDQGGILRKRLADDRDVLVRATAVGSIPDAEVDREIDVIRAALSANDVIVRANAIDRYALSKSEPRETLVKQLILAEERAHTDTLNDARVAAVRALGTIDFPEREKYLRQRVSDSDPIVRRIAAELIASELKKNRPQYTPLPVDRPLNDYIAIARWASERHTATIHMPRGKIQIVLLSQDAPMTAKNFADLAKSGFFNGTTFMRVVPNFVIQGGDPRNDMNGGPGYAIRDEINQQKYTRGAVGMALSGIDTGGSQFFINHSPQPHLDGGYTIFGRVVGGMSGVVDQTERGDRVETITIDEVKASENPDFNSVQRIPLPTEIGATTPERLLAMVPEYEERKNDYGPDRDVVQMLSSVVQPGDRVEVFLGTWCGDSQREVPRFFKILDVLKSDFHVEVPVSYVALNRSKKEPAPLVDGKAIDLVATFIVYRGDQEIGRVTEKPNGLLEDDLLLIFGKKDP